MITLELTTIQWLWLMVSMQLVLFAMGWLLCAQQLVDERPAIRGLGLFNLCLGIAIGLIGMRGVFPVHLTHTVSNLFCLGSFLLLWHSSYAFIRVSVARSELIWIMLIGGSAIVVFGFYPDLTYFRVATLYYAIAWALCRCCWLLSKQIRTQQFPKSIAMLVVIGVCVSLVLIGGATEGIMNPRYNGLDVDSGRIRGMAYFFFLGIFTINIVYAFLLIKQFINQLHRLSNEDSLTKLPNRRAFINALNSNWDDFCISNDNACIACIDIDHFKRVNDQYGHAAGDAVLVALAQVMRTSLRDIDLIARTGGEEFTVLFANTELDTAKMISTRVCDAVAHDAQLHPVEGQQVTVSVGVAQLSKSDIRIETALARADAALYDAKKEGRNRICVADQFLAGSDTALS